MLVQSVLGDHLKLHTTNAAITGQFNTTADLDLHSNNGYVQHAFFSPHGPRQCPRSSPSRSLIDAKVSLLPSSNSGVVGPYSVTAETSNAAIDLAFVDAPLDHVLTASARSSNGRVAVTTHEAYEGVFELRTSNARPPDVFSRKVDDPAGLGRKRAYTAYGVGRAGYHGMVWWDEDNNERGSVEAVTTNARVQLTL